MKAVRIHEFGGVEALSMDEVERPAPAPQEVLIEVRAAGVNPVDYKTREGKYPAVEADQLPLILGRDVAGTVNEVGKDVRRFQPGEAVYVMLPPDRGGYAEWVTAPASLCALKPATLDMVQAASIPLAALTAWQGLFTHGHLQPGQRVLIHGASGGVGHFAVQLARARGAEVWATAAGDMRAFVEGLGAHRVIDYHAERFEDAAKDMDLVYDLIGGETQDRSWPVLKPGGILVSTVRAPDRARAQAAQVTATRYTCQPDGEQLATIGAMIDRGEIKVTIDRVFPIDEAASAERHLEHDHVKGKVVLEVATA